MKKKNSQKITLRLSLFYVNYFVTFSTLKYQTDIIEFLLKKKCRLPVANVFVTTLN